MIVDIEQRIYFQRKKCGAQKRKFSYFIGGYKMNHVYRLLEAIKGQDELIISNKKISDDELNIIGCEGDKILKVITDILEDYRIFTLIEDCHDYLSDCITWEEFIGKGKERNKNKYEIINLFKNPPEQGDKIKCKTNYEKYLTYNNDYEVIEKHKNKFKIKGDEGYTLTISDTEFYDFETIKEAK